MDDLDVADIGSLEPHFQRTMSVTQKNREKSTGATKRSAEAILAERLGYRFRNPNLLREALTHESALGGSAPRGTETQESYQRLEFLGDRVLGFAIAELLLTAFPNASEGELSRRLNHLVKRETCAEIAQEIDLGDLAILAEAEARSGGRRKITLLGDMCEALIAALYLDGGWEPAAAFIHRHWRPRMLAWSGPLRDPKSALQEWAQAQGMKPPDYTIVARTGPDHQPRFTVEARIAGLAPARADGTSRRAGEQAAATQVLYREGIWPHRPDTATPSATAQQDRD